ncbi:MAG: ribonuclease Z [Clostridiales bacterium]|nr:ribonuclease Z [Candidatus Equinaster intestinalis]
MTVILCVDDDFGMTFFGKRQSSDKKLTERLLQNENLIISPFSAKLFEGQNVKISENPLGQADENSVCFIENENPADYIEKADKIILYKWNRRYPSDKKLDRALLENFRLSGTEEFEGNSHEKITQETYIR